ncbi:unannotated protein [freshwater metagenome]|uniref:Unannotated protein n=1 Tax=freshwater metagenome TaxID=449393 RepID=A0A6J7F2Z6_9ZZZZ|nr:amidase [Actinomycetota bacterium]
MPSPDTWPALLPTADPLGAFVSMFEPALASSVGTSSPLFMRTVAVKDIFDIAGTPTGAGNPTWAATHAAPTVHADAVARLLAAGAQVVGKTVTDELAYSLSGTNVHWGTPINSAAPGRVCGGSSCGSAAAVAGGLAEVGLGTDTGGSIRVPASYCGLVGFRPTHARVSLHGCVPLAPRFDTVGWLTRTAALSAVVGDVLLDPLTTHPGPPTELLVWDDAVQFVEPAAGAAVGTAMAAIADAFGSSRNLDLDARILADWAEAFRVLQGAAAWRTHGQWITGSQPGFGPGIAQRFASAAGITPDEQAAAEATARDAVDTLDALLGPGRVIALPAAADVAPPINASRELKDRLRPATLRLTCAAGLGGLPSISLPAGRSTGGLPIGVSLIGARNSDEHLLRLAARLEAAGSC